MLKSSQFQSEAERINSVKIKVGSGRKLKVNLQSTIFLDVNVCEETVDKGFTYVFTHLMNCIWVTSYNLLGF